MSRVVIASVAAGFLAMVVLAYRTGQTDSALPRPAPPFELPLLDGQNLRLSELRGSYVLLNFWATWCPPCVAETPDLIALASAYAGRGLKVVGISVDSDETVLREFFARSGINYPVARDIGATTAHRYGTFKYPETFLIDRDGRIVRQFVGLIDWMSPGVTAELDSWLAGRVAGEQAAGTN